MLLAVGQAGESVAKRRGTLPPAPRQTRRHACDGPIHAKSDRPNTQATDTQSLTALMGLGAHKQLAMRRNGGLAALAAVASLLVLSTAGSSAPASPSSPDTAPLMLAHNAAELVALLVRPQGSPSTPVSRAPVLAVAVLALPSLHPGSPRPLHTPPGPPNPPDHTYASPAEHHATRGCVHPGRHALQHQQLARAA